MKSLPISLSLSLFWFSPFISRFGAVYYSRWLIDPFRPTKSRFDFSTIIVLPFSSVMAVMVMKASLSLGDNAMVDYVTVQINLRWEPWVWVCLKVKVRVSFHRSLSPPTPTLHPPE
jgi:hypothetical protein